MADPHLLFEREGHVALVTLNRPESKNALSMEMMARMAEAWVEIDSNDEIRVAVVTGAGGDFCAGMDLKAFAGDFPDDEWQQRFEAVKSQEESRLADTCMREKGYARAAS